MKKILFVTYSMGIGGVEKALLGMLSAIPLTEYEVHLGLIHKKGDLLSDIPSNVIVHEIEPLKDRWREINRAPSDIIQALLGEGKLVKAFVHVFFHLISKITGTRYYYYRYLFKRIPSIPQSFDLAIAYAGPSAIIDYYVCNKVDAKTKCGWIHFDVSKFTIDTYCINRLYPSFNKVFIVSQAAKERFDSLFPKLTDLTEVFYNIVSPESVRELSKAGPSFSDEYQGPRVLTVGRISPEKGVYEAIEALGLLKDDGFDCRWYFVGDGKDRCRCETHALDQNVADSVIFLGTQKNPYRFMAECDIYVQPSRHEGYCITLCEAKCFSAPIVATCFTGAREQLQERENGFVVGMSPGEIAQGIKQAFSSAKIESPIDKDMSDVSQLLDLIS